jgi:uncharacterized membrane protein HdeD (DUF308 family)
VVGVVALGAGVIAFAWPDATFIVLAAIIGWYLLFRGTFDIVTALSTRREDDLWWVLLAAGIAQVLVAFWAVGYEGRSIVLLVVWVGATGLARGITDIVLAFRLRELERQG